MRAHVHLVCDIYCAYAYFCGCDSTIFCFRKLKSRRLIFLINLSVQFNNKHRKPSKKDEKRMINHANKENVFFLFQAFTWLVLCWWSSWSWRTWLKPRDGKEYTLKSGREKLTDFCGTSDGKSLFQLVVTFFKEDTNSPNNMKNMVFAHLPHPNQPRFQTAKMSKIF